MDKGGVTLLLRDSGVPLSEAYEATNAILNGESASVRLPSGSDSKTIRKRLSELGVIV